MKYCTKCGKECVDEAVICTNCGCAFEQKMTNEVKRNSGLKTAIKVLLILATIIQGFCIIPLIWCIPMTLSYCNKVKRGEPVGAGFAICTIFFLSTLGGILMLCDKN